MDMSHGFIIVRNFLVLAALAGVLGASLLFFWFKEEASESLFSDIFFAIIFISASAVIVAYRTQVISDIQSAFAIFCIAIALKLIFQALTRGIQKRFSKTKEKYAIIKRRRKLARFKNSHFFHLRVKKRHQPIRKPYKP